MKIKITKDCLCEHYLHEAKNYPREGLIKKEFSVGQEFEVKTQFGNFYGSYFRIFCEVNGEPTFADIAVHNAEIIQEETFPKEKNAETVKEFLETVLKNEKLLNDFGYLLIPDDSRLNDEALCNIKKKYDSFLNGEAPE
jgi:hypothetical protein